MHPMTCDQFEELISSLAEGTCDPALAAVAHRHTEGCTACASALADISALYARLQSAPTAQTPDLAAQVRARIDAEQVKRRQLFQRTWPAFAAAAALLAAALLVQPASRPVVQLTLLEASSGHATRPAGAPQLERLAAADGSQGWILRIPASRTATTVTIQKTDSDESSRMVFQGVTEADLPLVLPPARTEAERTAALQVHMRRGNGDTLLWVPASSGLADQRRSLSLQSTSLTQLMRQVSATWGVPIRYQGLPDRTLRLNVTVRHADAQTVLQQIAEQTGLTLSRQADGLFDFSPGS